jgi:ABC-2 type transport system ATP-binding protein/lipopolysaccharide transport system ATP-binding protein
MKLLTESNGGQPAQPVIQVENISVLYRLPRERITSFKEYAIRRLKRTIEYTEFWALRHVNLTVNRGEVVGIIGHNGAGKSTLLKVITRVLRPIEGRVQVQGQVAPMLELGTGFDFELTGRENIFLNSAILGYSRRNTEQRVSRIVEFAGLKEFIDAPLRTYSSGMVARLGFAVATDVEPDILIVDEVLSVGDVDFRTKAEMRIKTFQKRKSTILLVSHNLENIVQMCQRVVWLEHGRVRGMGDPAKIVKEYQQAVHAAAGSAAAPGA